jgi:hypothetical protein
MVTTTRHEARLVRRRRFRPPHLACRRTARTAETTTLERLSFAILIAFLFMIFSRIFDIP